jgi:predicted permease
VLSEVIWRSVFGGDPTLLGRRIRLDNASVVVVGIMAADFRFPTPATVAWRPLSVAADGPGVFTIFGRLKPGVPLAAAEERTGALARLLARFPRSYRGNPPLRRVGEPDLSDFTRRALWLLLGGVAMVFLVLSANVSSLLLANLSARQREFAMCTALGASRSRLVREAAAEHAIIGTAGAGAAVGVAWVLTSVVPHAFQGHTLNLIDIDVRALLTASGLGVASVILTGLVPAWLGTRHDPMEALRGSREAGTETRSARAVTRGLLVGEVALACSLLVGSALLVRSFANLVHADRGMNSAGVLRVSVGGLDDAFGSYEAMALAGAAIEERFRAWPAISEVALSRDLPPGPTPSQGGNVHLGAPGTMPDPGTTIPSDGYRVGAAFFDVYDIPIIRGRGFQPGDTEADVIVGERLANLLWPGQDPVERTFAVGRLPLAHRVVGVAGEIRLPALDPTLDRPEFYTPLGSRSRTLYVNFRCRASCPNEADIRAQVAAVHPALRARPVSSSEDEYLSQLRLPRAAAEVGGLFAVVAVLTAAGGLFSVLTCAVGRRRREFGIRTALGASPKQLQRLVFRDGISVMAIGVVAGVVAGWMVARSLAAFHYGVTAADPVTWAGVLGTVALTSLAAAWRPARQAMRIDPVRLLRDE